MGMLQYFSASVACGRSRRVVGAVSRRRIAAYPRASATGFASCNSTAAEHTFRIAQGLAQCVDFHWRVIEIEAGTAGGGNAKSLMQRHGTMVSCANGNAVAIEQLSNVVSVDSLHDKTDDARFMIQAGAEQ